MPVPIEELRPRLQAFDFPGLFVEGLGWNHYRAELPPLPVDGHEYALRPVAEKADFVVCECGPGPDGAIPAYPVRRKIESAAVKSHYEHLIIFVDAARTQQVWQWVRREAGKPPACREHRFNTGQTGQPLLQRLDSFLFTLEDEAKGIGISDVTAGVSKAFDVEKVTKRFYDRFQDELTVFGKFIDGITEQGDRDWYASLMLNRMMFVYFVQKQGFLDGNTDYLRTKLREIRSRYGDGRFQQFYREFLLKLFHDGLGRPVDQRNQELKDLLGRVPFLNGGLFDQHELERDNPGIEIPDAAFERVFNFFDCYRWHLDERPHRDDNEINPDVLGYIFEKYVNQKQMGAYYTKEDITGYISRNTVIPFLFDAARKECPVAFGPDGGVWRLLRDNPDRYIYPAVGHGIAWNARQAGDPKPLDARFELPGNIAAGVADVSKRGGWNSPAPDDYALPTETWREVVARRQRHDEVRDKLAAGDVREINDLITLNVDIERFAKDVIAQSEGPELLRAFCHAMRDISVLDPTCGSGAFLFAALNILEPLYTACLEGMRGFLDDLERSERPHGPNALSDFKDVLDQVKKHPSERYFILKSIVLNNLYGVDIEQGAVEICKLRLFLKLVAQLERYEDIEPLPDIDFNIRSGNTLVGFTSLDAVREAMTVTPYGQRRQVFPEDQAALDRIDEEAEIASVAFNQFRWQQTMLGGEVTSADKQALRDRLRSLDDELDRLLAAEYGVDLKKAVAYDAWRASHQPFHWFVEFYGVMSKGGFDVVIGNPPYVATQSIKYSLGRHVGHRYPDIYAHVLIRSMALTVPFGRSSMIVPLSVTFSRDFTSLRGAVCDWGAAWFSSFDNIPAALFAGVSQRCTIWVGHESGKGLLVAPMYRWRSATRPHLMASMAYVSIDASAVAPNGAPKLGEDSHAGVFQHISAQVKTKYRSILQANTPMVGRLGFSQSARNFVSVFVKDPPCLDASSLSLVPSSKVGYVSTPTENDAFAALAATSGELFFWYWLLRGDGFDVTSWLVRDYLSVLDRLPDHHYDLLVEIGRILHRERNTWLVFKKNAGRFVGNFNYRGAPNLTRRADMLTLAAIALRKGEALSLFDYVQRVLAINEHAGEKAIPDTVKSLFPVVIELPELDEEMRDEADALIKSNMGFTDEELDFIINYDIKYRMGREG